MPSLSRKRRAQPESEDESSPEPQPQRRRPTNAAAHRDSSASDSEAGPDSSTAEPVKKLIRLALACEYTRRPLKRPEITEKCLAPGQTRQFQTVFAEAQNHLQNIFGMEMVALPAREARTVAQKKALLEKGGKAGQAQWVLRSVLPAEFHDPEIVPPGGVPTGEEEGTYSGVYSVLIALVALSGGSLPEAKLERFLRRLGMEDATPVAGCAKTEQLLKRLEREGYLVKVKESTSTAGEEDVSWSVGPRGKVEVGRMGVSGLVGAVYGEQDEEGEREMDRRVQRSLGEFGIERPRVVSGGDGEPKKRGRKKKGEVEEVEVEEDEDLD